MNVVEAVDARKQKIDAKQAWELISGAAEVTVAKGKKVVAFESVAGQREAALKQVMGPSGNLRAPTFRIGDRFIVGFHQEMYEAKLK